MAACGSTPCWKCHPLPCCCGGRLPACAPALPLSRCAGVPYAHRYKHAVDQPVHTSLDEGQSLLPVTFDEQSDKHACDAIEYSACHKGFWLAEPGVYKVNATLGVVVSALTWIALGIRPVGGSGFHPQWTYHCLRQTQAAVATEANIQSVAICAEVTVHCPQFLQICVRATKPATADCRIVAAASNDNSICTFASVRLVCACPLR